MKISVIVTVYNIDPYLPRCVESILAQDYRDYELILVDDGSTDSSGRICDEYARKDSRIRVLHKKNGGVTSARKAGAEIARGEYVTVIDGDDRIGEGYLKDIVQGIDSTNADLLLWNGRILENGKEIFCHNRCEQGFYDPDRIRKLRDKYFYDPEEPGMNRGQLLFSVCPTAVRRDVFVSCQRMIDERILEGEDVLLLWLILNAVQTAYVCGIDRYYYCPRPSSATHSLHKNRVLSHKLLEKALRTHRHESKDEENRMNVFLLFNLCMLIERYARNSRYPVFRSFIRYCEKAQVFSCVDEARITAPTKGERIKQLLLRYRLWLPLYLFYRSRQCVRDGKNMLLKRGATT